MKCSKCGTELKEGAKFCKSCGAENKQVRWEPLGGKTGNFESEQVVNEILRNLSLLTQDYQKKTEQIKTLMKSNEKFVLELKEKQALLNRKNDEIRELKNNAEKYKELVKQLTSEVESLKVEQQSQAEGEESVMKCPNCGAKIDSHTNFCGECGRKIQ